MYSQEDLVYIYDGSYEGFLCCIYESIYSNKTPQAIMCEANYQPNLWQPFTIYTDKEKAQRVEKSFAKRINFDAEALVKTVFLSALQDKELKILGFLHFAYKTGARATQLLAHEAVAPMWSAYRNLHNEKHLLLGFLRFIDVGGALVAFITPKNFVLPFIKHHFCTRLANEKFLIYDKTHKAALIYKDGAAEICDIDKLEIPDISEEELLFQALWKRFYDTVAIEARMNERCRMGHMPKRYWENMTEMQDISPS